MNVSRKVGYGLNLLLFAFLFFSVASCNKGRPPFHLKLYIEQYGPTDISGMTGNGRLSVAINDRGTITVFKWPNPSFYDHIKYMTSSRDKPLFGALPNEGAFSGLYYQTETGSGFTWLRDSQWRITQQYHRPDSLILVTRFENPELKLTVEQYDFVDPELDLLRRHYKIERAPGSPVKTARLILYANFNPVLSKIPKIPIQDWCLEYMSDSTLEFDSKADAFIQFKTGKDFSTKKTSSVFLALGLDVPSDTHQAGEDSIARIYNPRSNDPFFQASTGKLSGSDFARGQVSAGISKQVDLSQNSSAELSFLIAAAESRQKALSILEQGRAIPFSRALEMTHSFWSRQIASCPMPDTDNPDILRVARLSLLVLIANFCKDSDAIVASIATQGPYGEDWPRDGSFINEALQAAGFHDLVEKHNLFYVRHQATEDNPVFFHVPPGNWASNYWADGTPGFHASNWEIDVTGFLIWTLWSHYRATMDRAYLEEVYPAITRAADFLTMFRDTKTGLPRRAHEQDIPYKQQTLCGAVTAYLGLKHAVMAAQEMNDDKARVRWAERSEELKNIMLTEFYSEDLKYFVKTPGSSRSSGGIQAWILWPAELVSWDDPRAHDAARDLWQRLQPSLELERKFGSYEIIPILSLAKVWKDDQDKLAGVQDALVWEATVRTNDLGHFGEVWMKQGNRVVTGQSQPHVTHHALFYLAAIEAFGER